MKAFDKKKKELAKMSAGEARTAKETPTQQKLNRIGRAGMKRPEHGNWPVFKKK